MVRRSIERSFVRQVRRFLSVSKKKKNLIKLKKQTNFRGKSHTASTCQRCKIALRGCRASLRGRTGPSGAERGVFRYGFGAEKTGPYGKFSLPAIRNWAVFAGFSQFRFPVGGLTKIKNVHAEKVGDSAGRFDTARKRRAGPWRAIAPPRAWDRPSKAACLWWVYRTGKRQAALCGLIWGSSGEADCGKPRHGAGAGAASLRPMGRKRGNGPCASWRGLAKPLDPGGGKPCPENLRPRVGPFRRFYRYVR